MSAECVVVIALDEPFRSHALALHARSRAALERATKAPPGERTDIVRHERAQGELETLAIAARNAGAPSQMLSEAASGSSALLDPAELPRSAASSSLSALADSGFALVQVALPFTSGKTATPERQVEREPARRWSKQPGTSRVEAVSQRFAEQVEMVVDAEPQADGSNEAIAPSGVPNMVLTKVLRQFAAATPGGRAVGAPVRYRDGSSPRPFPLGAIELVDDRSDLGRTLRFALLSIRHVELDAMIDGAWLRNSEVSRPRPMAFTDELVYTESRKQLALLTETGPVTIVMYQTGLEPAIVGLYRAVIHHLLEQPGSLAVLPCFYSAGGVYGDGLTWRTP